ncbi:ATP-binding protein [Streptomyces sp. NPDC057950]|uniref:ATP-binding protein n=1 Tax=Streptomyces sp. NPDC057950 TaxID=3346288 RepID=UPI0036EA70B0
MTASGAPRREPPHDVPVPSGLPSASGVRPGEPAVFPVVPPGLLRATVPAQASRAAGVRTLVAECLARLRLPPEPLDNAVLATGELFANAVGHGSSGPADTITVTLERTGHELRVTVADASAVLPRPRTTDPATESGRGLAIVAALSDDWGIAPPDPGTTGKKVWFTLVLRGMP